MPVRFVLSPKLCLQVVQTHFINVDMSIPDFVDRQDHLIIHSTRSGYRNWHNPYQDPEGNKQGADEEEPQPLSINDDEDEDDEEDGMLDKTGQGPKEGQGVATANETSAGGAEQDDAKDIQILDLHSSKPIVGYRGRVFTGEWSANIGTELLFTSHSSREDLPVLRKLSEETDLLGISAARITCIPAELWPRPQEVDDKLQAARAQNGFAIPVHSDVSGSRQPQAAFLERLMAIKAVHGETDLVTVKAVDSRHDMVLDDPVEEARRRKRKKDQARSRERWAALHPPAEKGRRRRGRAQRWIGSLSGARAQTGESVPTPATLRGMVNASRGGSSHGTGG